MLKNYQIKKIAYYGAGIVCCMLAAWLIIASARIFVFTKQTESLANQISPYRQTGKGQPDILILGDSLAYGTGASNPESTLAGLFGQYFPDATITNKAQNGTKSKTLADRIATDIDRNYDIILVIVGSNDIMHGEVDLGSTKGYLSTIYQTASLRGKHVIAVSSGNFRDISFFLYPLNHYYGHRSEVVRDDTMAIAASHKNIVYIDTFLEPATQALQARDHLHLSDIGALYWFKKILGATNNLGF